jgi:hypothetical protein
MRDAALQGFSPMIEALLRIAQTIEQLAAQCPRTAIELTMESDNVWHN